MLVSEDLWLEGGVLTIDDLLFKSVCKPFNVTDGLSFEYHYLSPPSH